MAVLRAKDRIGDGVASPRMLRRSLEILAAEGRRHHELEDPGVVPAQLQRL